MTALTTQESFILELFNLEEENVQSVTYSNLNGDAVADIFLVPSYEPCPECGCVHPTVYNYVTKKIKHSILTDRKCILRYHARRYKCPVCERTYYEHNPFVFKNMRISSKTVIQILQDLKSPSDTYSSVAARYHVSPTTVASVFDSHVEIPRQALPEMLNFDEVYAFKYGRSKYVCVLLDFKTHSPVDILNSRELNHLKSYFSSIPLEERKKVKACCFDMYAAYRSVMKNYLPNSIGIVDHFHMVQELTRQVDHVRIQVMKRYPKSRSEDEYYLLKKFNWLIYKNPNDKDKQGISYFDADAPKKWNNHFKRQMNYYDIYDLLLKIDYELTECINLRDCVTEFYSTNTIDTAEKELDTLIKIFRDSNIEEMVKFSRTMTKWRTEIINSFTVYDKRYRVNKQTGLVAVSDIRMSNAIIENRNSIIKTIKKNGNGFTNWKRFRNRVLYVLDKNTQPRLNPIEDKGKK